MNDDQGQVKLKPVNERHLPGAAMIDAYGNGGFRFADMSHKGSLMILPSGCYPWDADSFDGLASKDFDRIIAHSEEIELLLIGAGKQNKPLPAAIKEYIKEAGVRVEVMDTGAAARTFNVLLCEKRSVGVALIAVD